MAFFNRGGIFVKLCFSCFRLSQGRPQVCSYCGRSWDKRICQRGHVSSPDAAFCATCGSTNLTPASPRIPLLLQVGFWLVTGVAALYLLIHYLPVILVNVINLALYCIIVLVIVFCLVLIFPPVIRIWLWRIMFHSAILTWKIFRGILSLLFSGAPQGGRVKHH